MSWKFPKHRPVTTDTLDKRDINENFTLLVDEFSGEINEHNLHHTLVTDGAYLEDGAGITAEHYFFPAPPTAPPTPSGFAHVLVDDTWNKLSGPGGPYAVTFVSSGAPVWILASFQGHFRSEPAGAGTQVQPGYNFALMVDGAILYQSLVGGGDLTNDHVRQATVGMTQGPGVTGYYIPLVLETVVDLPPGEHTINVCSRAIHSYTPTSAIAVREIGVLSRELILLELTR